jgi:hypothetical protein
LNDSGIVGGSTKFYEDKDTFGARDAQRSNYPLPTIEISPKQGLGLIFNHDVVHEGEQVTFGVKYILRTDIMFERVENLKVQDEIR